MRCPNCKQEIKSITRYEPGIIHITTFTKGEDGYFSVSNEYERTDSETKYRYECNNCGVELDPNSLPKEIIQKGYTSEKTKGTQTYKV